MPKIQVRRGTSQEIGNIIPDVGEPFYVTDTKSFGIGNGINTAGKGSFDGQWVNASATIVKDVSLQGSSKLTYTLSNVPNDGYAYEVLLMGAAVTGTTSGDYVSLNVSSDRLTVSSRICTVRTRTNANNTTGGSIILPLTNSRNIYIDRDPSWVGTASLYFRGYRRIGTNE